MSVSATDSRIQYTSSAGQTEFTYPFEIFEDADLQVYLTPSGQTPDPTLDILTLNIDYTVSGAGNENGGIVTLTNSASEDDIITINRNILIDRETDFTTGGPFRGQAINDQLDKLTLICQQLETFIVQRMLLYQVTDNLTDSDRVLPQLQANQYWKKNSAGKLAAVTDEECSDCSTLRSELASETQIAPGAELVGFYDSHKLGSTNVDAFLKTLGVSTGTAWLTLETVAPDGWVLMDDGTIGNASSGGTTRANADTEDLFKLAWNNVSDTYAPVSGGRGASAQEDFDADKNIGLTKVLGRALCIAGTGSALTARTLGETLGEETHQLTLPEIPSHGHGFDGGGQDMLAGVPSGGIYAPAAGSDMITTQIADSGGDQPHNNMQPSSFWNIKIKL